MGAGSSRRRLACAGSPTWVSAVGFLLALNGGASSLAAEGERGLQGERAAELSSPLFRGFGESAKLEVEYWGREGRAEPSTVAASEVVRSVGGMICVGAMLPESLEPQAGGSLRSRRGAGAALVRHGPSLIECSLSPSHPALVPPPEVVVIADFENGLGVVEPSYETVATILNEGAIGGAASLVLAMSPNPGGIVNGDGTTTVAVACFIAFGIDPGAYKLAVDARVLSDVLPTTPITFSVSGNDAVGTKTVEPSEFEALAEPIDGLNYATAPFTVETPEFSSDGSISGCMSLAKLSTEPANPRVIVDDIRRISVGAPVPSISVLQPVSGLPGACVTATGSFPANTRLAVVSGGLPVFAVEPLAATADTLEFQFPLDAAQGASWFVIPTTSSAGEILAGTFVPGVGAAFQTTEIQEAIEGMTGALTNILNTPGLTNKQRNRTRQALHHIEAARESFKRGKANQENGEVGEAWEHNIEMVEDHFPAAVDEIVKMQQLGLSVGDLAERVGELSQFVTHVDIKDFQADVGLGAVGGQIAGLFDEARLQLCLANDPQGALQKHAQISGLLQGLGAVPSFLSKYAGIVLPVLSVRNTENPDPTCSVDRGRLAPDSVCSARQNRDTEFCSIGAPEEDPDAAGGRCSIEETSGDNPRFCSVDGDEETEDRTATENCSVKKGVEGTPECSVSGPNGTPEPDQGSCSVQGNSDGECSLVDTEGATGDGKCSMLEGGNGTCSVSQSAQDNEKGSCSIVGGRPTGGVQECSIVANTLTGSVLQLCSTQDEGQEDEGEAACSVLIGSGEGSGNGSRRCSVKTQGGEANSPLQCSVMKQEDLDGFCSTHGLPNPPQGGKQECSVLNERGNAECSVVGRTPGDLPGTDDPNPTCSVRGQGAGRCSVLGPPEGQDPAPGWRWCSLLGQGAPGEGKCSVGDGATGPADQRTCSIFIIGAVINECSTRGSIDSNGLVPQYCSVVDRNAPGQCSVQGNASHGEFCSTVSPTVPSTGSREAECSIQGAANVDRQFCSVMGTGGFTGPATPGSVCSVEGRGVPEAAGESSQHFCSVGSYARTPPGIEGTCSVRGGSPSHYQRCSVNVKNLPDDELRCSVASAEQGPKPAENLACSVAPGGNEPVVGACSVIRSIPAATGVAECSALTGSEAGTSTCSTYADQGDSPNFCSVFQNAPATIQCSTIVLERADASCSVYAGGEGDKGTCSLLNVTFNRICSVVGGSPAPPTEGAQCSVIQGGAPDLDGDRSCSIVSTSEGAGDPFCSVSGIGWGTSASRCSVSEGQRGFCSVVGPAPIAGAECSVRTAEEAECSVVGGPTPDASCSVFGGTTSQGTLPANCSTP